MMYRIKHIPTGLYYQPRKYRGNNLSKNGKVYHKRPILNKPITLVLHSGSRVYNEIKENAGWLFDTKTPSVGGVHLLSEPEHFKIEVV